MASEYTRGFEDCKARVMTALRARAKDAAKLARAAQRSRATRHAAEFSRLADFLLECAVEAEGWEAVE